MMYGGVDPSAHAKRPTGCAILDRHGCLIEAGHVFTDKDILAFFETHSIKTIGIDAPKGLPLEMGLCCLETHPECDCPEKASRLCEREMRKRGMALFPVGKNAFPTAKAWIRRGLLLFLRLQGLGYPCFEVYPNAAKKILFPKRVFPKPKSSVKSRKTLQEALRKQISAIPNTIEILYSDHTLDAILTAYTVYLYQEKNMGCLIGDPREGEILIPGRNG